MPMALILFEQAVTIDILIVLLKTERLKISELVRRTDRPQLSVYKAIPKLAEAGLINDEVTPYPKKRYISLTEKGREVANRLYEISKILES
jgi:DNA-binding MarR family transcriptional regulator